jgi:hypothetical protein
MTRISCALLIVLFTAVLAVSQSSDSGWPRKFAVGTNSVAVYQPQIEEWFGNSLSARAAIAITENQSRQPLYGVLWFSARAETLIANAIPQTATITRSAATLTVNYDSSPQFKSINNTTLRYAVNTSTPVIRIDASSYYAVQNGVWFVATSAIGPWAVATSVPVAIYTIPVSSPLHYVTYVKIYGSTPEVVYVGYTPGYYGTIVTSSSVVVYGTGWYYPPGQAGQITNVYNGNSAAGARGAAYNPNTGVISGGAVGGVRNGSTGQVTAGGGGFAYNTRTNTGVAVGNNNVYASKDGSLYRYNQSTGMQQKTSSGWETVQRSADRSWVQNQQNARGLGEMRTRDFSSMRGNLRNGGGGFRRR